jgi:hypothetical protein
VTDRDDDEEGTLVLLTRIGDLFNNVRSEIISVCDAPDDGT